MWSWKSGPCPTLTGTWPVHGSPVQDMARKKEEANTSLWWLMTGHEAVSTNRSPRCSICTYKNSLLYCEGGRTLEQFPQRGKESASAEIHNTQLGIAHSACWSWPCLSSRVGLGDLQRPFQALILCFRDSVPLFAFLLPHYSQSI